MQDQDVNPSEIVSEGKNVDDAIEKALERLGVTRDQVDFEVLEEGTQGVFGLIGVKQARVVVRKKGADGDVSAKIEEMVNDLLRLMGIVGQVTIRLEDDIHRVDIETAAVDGLLIGKKGESLEDMGHLLRRMVGKQLKKSVRMDIDVGGYKRRRSSALKSKAISLAARVKATGKEMQMEPLSAAERRVVHLALADDPQIGTHTVGEGDLKNVVISSARRGARNAGGGGQGGRKPSGEPDQGHGHDSDEPKGGGAEGEAWSAGE
jgi:spoIIIJ-associated protein